VPEASASAARRRRRFANVLIQPGIQLGLPALVLGITFAFAALQAVHGYLAFGRLYRVVMAETSAPVALQAIITGQTGDFLVVSCAIILAYMLVVVIVSVAWAHRMVGPTVPFRRHLEALKNGEYSSRVHLRRFDAFPEMARDLNELAEILETQEKPRS
jgi:hypothetical protein